MTTYGLSRNTAKKYVDFCRDTWSNYIDLRREFLETWMVQKLVSEISNPNSNEAVRAKNLSTLQKYLDKMPDNQIDACGGIEHHQYSGQHERSHRLAVPERAGP